MSTEGSTSGLHHDYHDNLYILLRGRKRFRLYSPGDVDSMYTRGTLLKVHPNGRINYEGDETTAYGADLHSDQAASAFSAQQRAEKEVYLASCPHRITYPVSFSRVKTSRPNDDLQREFPRFADARAAFCDVNVGEMLYLPASWFHEVVSFNGATDDGHLALNYWYHPPDATDCFATPYTSPFWTNDYAARNLAESSS
ncbi:hypothetical protein B5M09_006953 [Aphanomyces astaci]|uniref:JmjC domain-containing protein n=1 Tax=Aphanomyces astaci TaxID=112090 RepID=A0A425DIV5_APHAT|nr:hypothetical protein B5M09_006953 [Aphanomyces astaci]